MHWQDLQDCTELGAQPFANRMVRQEHCNAVGARVSKSWDSLLMQRNLIRKLRDSSHCRHRFLLESLAHRTFSFNDCPLRWREKLQPWAREDGRRILHIAMGRPDFAPLVVILGISRPRSCISRMSGFCIWISCLFISHALALQGQQVQFARSLLPSEQGDHQRACESRNPGRAALRTPSYPIRQ